MEQKQLQKMKSSERDGKQQQPTTRKKIRK